MQSHGSPGLCFHIPSALGNLSQWPPPVPVPVPGRRPILLAHGALLNAAQRAVGGWASGSAPLSLSSLVPRCCGPPSLLLHFPTPPPLQTLPLFIQSAFFASPIRRSPLDHPSWISNHCASRFIPAYCLLEHLCPRGASSSLTTTIVLPSREPFVTIATFLLSTPTPFSGFPFSNTASQSDSPSS